MERTNSAKFGKHHEGKCVDGTEIFYGCGKSGHQLKDCPICASKGKESTQTPTNTQNPNDPKNNYFYSLCSKGDQEGYPDVVTGIL